jgi:hypothetical protein
VAREVHEETSIVVGQVRYLGSQPWPMPRSLMLGYEARAKGGQQIAVDEEEIGEARWFTRAQLRAAIDTGELGLAPTSSIARRMIEFWYGEELPDGTAGWVTRARYAPLFTGISRLWQHCFLTKPTNLVDYSSEGV